MQKLDFWLLEEGSQKGVKREEGVKSRSGPIFQSNGSPDPYQNVTDPDPRSTYEPACRAATFCTKKITGQQIS
jgi:hypothetical protein